MSMRRFTAADLEAHLDTGQAVTYRSLTQGLVTLTGLAPAPSLLHALVRECRDMGPTLESRASAPLGRRGDRCIGVCVGCLSVFRTVSFMLCYVMLLQPQ